MIDIVTLALASAAKGLGKSRRASCFMRYPELGQIAEFTTQKNDDSNHSLLLASPQHVRSCSVQPTNPGPHTHPASGGEA